VTASVEESEYRHDRNDSQANDENQRQAGNAQVVACPDLLVEEQLEPAAAVPATFRWFIKLVRSH
jgi:hypothetical protein